MKRWVRSQVYSSGAMEGETKGEEEGRDAKIEENEQRKMAEKGIDKEEREKEVYGQKVISIGREGSRGVEKWKNGKETLE